MHLQGKNIDLNEKIPRIEIKIAKSLWVFVGILVMLSKFM